MVARESLDQVVEEEGRWSPFGEVTAHDQRNMARLGSWLLAWLLPWVGVRLLMEGWEPAQRGALAWALVALATLPGLMAIRAYVRFLREADELLRKIQLEALGVAFGIGAVLMMAWRLVEKAGGPQADVNDPLLLMLGVWLLAQWRGARRYR